MQDIILEVAKEYEAKTGTREQGELSEADRRAQGARRHRAQAAGQGAAGLGAVARRWPAQKAKELDAAGLPGTQVLEIALKAAEDNGHKWPLRYNVK